MSENQEDQQKKEQVQKVQKKLLTNFEVFLLAGLVIGAAYLMMQKMGYSPVKKTETVEIVNRKSSSKYVKKQTKNKMKSRSSERSEAEREVEEMLKHLDGNQLYEGEVAVSTYVSKDEAKYRKEVKAEHDLEAKLRDSKDLFHSLQKAHSTYNKVKNIFSNPELPEAPNSVLEDVNGLLENEMVANSIYNKLEDMFLIPKEKSAAFAKSGKKAVSDWAKFVEENENR